jgi:hypothetical protein
MLETGTTAPETPAEGTARVSRVWRMVLIVVSAQLALIAVGMVLFGAMGLANDGTGGCGGG